MMKEVKLSVILPAYNESVNLRRGVLAEVYDYLCHHFSWFEMILADDGSTDDTLQWLHKFAEKRDRVKVLPMGHRGKGPTIKTALETAEGDWKLFADIDQSTPIASLAKFVPLIDQGYQVLIGSRELKASKREAEPWYRHLMGKVFNLVVRLVAVPGISDTQCGFKLFTAEVLEMILPKLRVTVGSKKDAFTGAMDVELLYLVKKNGYMLTEVPVNWRHVSSVRVSPIKDSVRMLIEVIKIRWTDIVGGYE